MSKADEAWVEYQFEKMVDPVKRYTHDDKEIFEAGWRAATKPVSVNVKESVWVHAPVAPDDDPE